MRLLFLTCHLPYPPHSGGRLREHELLARLGERFDVHVAAVTKTLEADRDSIGAVPWRHAGISLFPAAQLGGMEGVAPQVARHRSASAGEGVRRLVTGGGFDAIHVEGFYLWQHVAGLGRLPCVLVEQNIEWQLYEQRGLASEARATRRAELAAWRSADVLGALTDEDVAVMRRHTGRPVQLVPDGADHLPGMTARTSTRSGGRRLLMVGNFGYEPNVDGALWLAREVLPQIRARVPDVELQLVGTSPPPEVRALACEPGIEVTGAVPDVRPYLAEADVVLCPLRFGGGVKVKTLEALSAGKAIVSTAIGCQGLGSARDAVHVHDSADAFAGAAARLLGDARERARAERAAVRAVLPRWDDAADALAECWTRAADLSLAAA